MLTERLRAMNGLSQEHVGSGQAWVFQCGKLFACLMIFENDPKSCYRAGHRQRTYAFLDDSKDEEGDEEEK